MGEPPKSGVCVHCTRSAGEGKPAMTWVKIDVDTLEQPKIMAIPRYARLVHLEAILWSSRQLSDGRIPRHMLDRLTDEPNAVEAAAELVAGRLWRATKTGWQIIGFKDDYMSKDEILEHRKAEADRLRAFRKRAKLHGDGDHTMCDSRWCEAKKTASKVSASPSGGAKTAPKLAPVPKISIASDSRWNGAS
jgi:hypothetical protein